MLNNKARKADNKGAPKVNDIGHVGSPIIRGCGCECTSCDIMTTERMGTREWVLATA
jgi:hypothetical protein